MLEFSVFIVGLLSMLIGVVNVLESDQDIRRFGYRVRSVLQTKESWQFANKVFGVMLVSMGAIALVIGIILNSYIRLLSPFEVVMINVLELVVIVLISMAVTEIRVKQLFNKEGKQK
ncbi:MULTISPECIES: SdpI family protein [Turicibacter]|jgi:hypothetical protein|uniref:Uncharacterized protein n=2 Tax=Turicibacter sanguinis TaxID=154288 RepID=A0A173TBW0_9FIRM|nr:MULTISPECIES: SdpI family protein [Turicibacter]EFF64041.1 hypothetical protein CUW_0348 [Turicibacter sanguinis PC909]MBP3904326.1 SdpI family protein [Turicibacter sp.]MCU7190867.1 SdpI family protein [Turicibacter sanguinis]MCU7195729.1 SdpI family protein [Turicibacter sanguinis]MCU7203067.1 SdpI family protein [Turicibacter sanguinis]